MFKDDLDLYISKRVNKKLLVDDLMSKYSISKEEVHKRVRSYYGCSLTDALEPSEEEFVKALIISDDINQLKDLLQISTGLGSLYEKYFGVSTYSRAKILVDKKRFVARINPTREDNFSVLISQHIGDGYLFYRGLSTSISITHGIKQYDYLSDKVKILSKQFPELPSVGSIKVYKHKQGHTYCQWRSVLKNSFMKKILEAKKCDLIKHLTPLGVCLLYLDDGSLCVTNNGLNRHLSIACKDQEIRLELIKLLRSYGIESKLSTNILLISDTVNILKFLSCFVKPFKHLFSECMHYKMDLVI